MIEYNRDLIARSLNDITDITQGSDAKRRGATTLGFDAQSLWDWERGPVGSFNIQNPTLREASIPKKQLS